MSKTREEQKRDLYFAYKEKKLSIHQFRAQMRDLGYAEWEINIFLDTDGEPE